MGLGYHLLDTSLELDAGVTKASNGETSNATSAGTMKRYCAAEGYQAPGVLVYYSPEGMDNPAMVNEFLKNGMQVRRGGETLGARGKRERRESQEKKGSD